MPASNIGRALDFYRDVLEMEVHTDVPMGDGGRWVFMRIPGGETMLHLGHYALEPDAEGTVPMLALVTDDVDAEAKRMKAGGCPMVDEPQQAPWNGNVRYATFRDSEGNLIMMQSSSKEP